MSTINSPARWLDAHGVVLARVALIPAIFLGSAALAIASTLPLSTREVGVLAAGTAALLAFPLLRWPALGIVALAGGTLAVPVSIGTGTNTSINIAVVMVSLMAAIWVLHMAMQHRAELIPSAATIPALALIPVGLLAFFAGFQPWLYYVQTASLPAQAGGLALWILSAVAFLVTAHQLPNMRWLQVTTWVFLAVAAIHIAGYIVPGAREASFAMLGRARLGSIFFVWVAALTFSQSAFNRTLALKWRLLLAALLLATLYVGLVIQRDWSSGWLPVVVAIAVTLVAGAPRALPLIVVAGLAVASTRASKLYELTMGGDNEYSLATRLEAWRIVGEITSINPMLGLGFANYYWYTPHFPIVGTDGFAYAVPFNSHSNLVDIVAQTGLVGLAVFLWFAAAVGWVGWRLRSVAQAGFARAYVLGAVGGVAGVLTAAVLGDWVIPFVYNVGFDGFRSSVLAWIFLGGLLVIERAVRNETAPGEQHGRVWKHG